MMTGSPNASVQYFKLVIVQCKLKRCLNTRGFILRPHYTCCPSVRLSVRLSRKSSKLENESSQKKQTRYERSTGQE